MFNGLITNDEEWAENIAYWKELEERKRVLTEELEGVSNMAKALYNECCRYERSRRAKEK